MASIPEYRLVRTIGSGVFGYVFEAENKKTKQRLAIKRVEKVGQQLSREYQILHMIQGCQNIVKLKDFFFSKNDKGKLIQNMVFEYIDDNLENLIDRHIKIKKKIPELQIKNYMYQLLKGLEYIHTKNIAHRDLKPENILYSSQGFLKICDFGSSKVIDSSGKNTPYIVSRYYRAPELILSITRYGTQIDIWSAGCILAELFLLKPFFKGKSEGDQLFQILNILGEFSDLEIKHFKQMVSYDTSIFEQFSGYEKQDLSQIFNMVEDQENFIDLLEKMLTYLPQKRITAKQALKHPFFKQQHSQKHTKMSDISNSLSTEIEMPKTNDKNKRK